jgi:multidrug efflux pump subunit AcrB
LLPDLRAQLPAGIELKVLIDRSATIRQSTRRRFTLLLSVALVVLVISLPPPSGCDGNPHPGYHYLVNDAPCRDVSASFSLNNLSLMALTLCVGFVVDDAIVVLENIVRHLEKESPRDAALRGSMKSPSRSPQ